MLEPSCTLACGENTSPDSRAQLLWHHCSQSSAHPAAAPQPADTLCPPGTSPLWTCCKVPPYPSDFKALFRGPLSTAQRWRRQAELLVAPFSANTFPPPNPTYLSHFPPALHSSGLTCPKPHLPMAPGRTCPHPGQITLPLKRGGVLRRAAASPCTGESSRWIRVGTNPSREREKLHPAKGSSQRQREPGEGGSVLSRFATDGGAFLSSQSQAVGEGQEHEQEAQSPRCLLCPPSHVGPTWAQRGPAAAGNES